MEQKFSSRKANGVSKVLMMMNTMSMRKRNRTKMGPRDAHAIEKSKKFIYFVSLQITFCSKNSII